MPVNKYAAFYGHLLFPGTHMVTGYVMVVGTVDRVVNALEAIPATCSAAASCLLKHHRIPLIRRVAQDGSKSYVATESCGLTGLTDDATFGFKVELFSAVEASIFLRKWIFEKLNLSDDGASDLPKILCAEEGVIPDELVLVAEIVIEALGSRVGECAYGDLPAYVGVGCLRRCLRRFPCLRRCWCQCKCLVANYGAFAGRNTGIPVILEHSTGTEFL